jgi:hypothetical protein
MNYCIWCDKEFIPNSSKQIYCSIECRQEASKEKILERYHVEKRKKRKNKVRLCAGGCGTKLSMYNDSGICDNCEIHTRRINNFIKDLRGYFEYEIQ